MLRQPPQRKGKARFISRADDRSGLRHFYAAKIAAAYDTTNRQELAAMLAAIKAEEWAALAALTAFKVETPQPMRPRRSRQWRAAHGPPKN
jgi:hypothetical protein